MYSLAGSIEDITEAIYNRWVTQLAEPNSWQGIVTVYALSSVLTIPIDTWYPPVNMTYCVMYTRTCCGRGVPNTGIGNATIMFTTTGYNKDKEFTMNHFVPLIKKNVSSHTTALIYY